VWGARFQKGEAFMRREFRHWIACTSIAFLLNHSGSSIAQDVEAATREACTPDAFRLCSLYLLSGEEQITNCMTAKFRQVSPQCRAAMIKEDNRARAQVRRVSVPTTN
jgi:hypothetical protein